MNDGWFNLNDVSAGDRSKAATLDVSRLQVTPVRHPDHPLFAQAYSLLELEFGAKNELESQSVLRERLSWQPSRSIEDFKFRYEMLVVTSQGVVVGVADHTAIVPVSLMGKLMSSGAEGGGELLGAWVHVSHLWVKPEWRRTGLSGWMRSWPIQCGRACLREAGGSGEEAVTLMAEVEPLVAGDLERSIRMATFERGGFKLVNPRRLNYLQPDFRSIEVLDREGGAKPLPLMLLLRRVGCEDENGVSGRELRAMVAGLYAMYGQHMRGIDMERVWRSLETYPGDDGWVELLDPSRAPVGPG